MAHLRVAKVMAAGKRAGRVVQQTPESGRLK
jgi:hypothetical protein